MRCRVICQQVGLFSLPTANDSKRIMIGKVVTVVSTVVAEEEEAIFFFLAVLLLLLVLMISSSFVLTNCVSTLFLVVAAAAAAAVSVVVAAHFSKHLTTCPFSSTHPTKIVDLPPLRNSWTKLVLVSRDDTEMGGVVVAVATLPLVLLVNTSKASVDEPLWPLLLSFCCCCCCFWW